ncbi:MAG: universal stress protein [Planctomycetes bacterium]|nr:universal stress protein [Planctomycetota bacterium]
MLRKILVPLDGSALADRILTHVRRILLREEAEVMLLRVMPPPTSQRDERVQREELELASAHLEERLRALAALGARVRFDLMTGDPAEQLLQFAAGYAPSLIAMSTHGLTAQDRWPYGSVTARVLRRARHPLFVSTPLGFADADADTPAVLPFRVLLVPLDGSETSARILPLVEHMAHLYESEVVLVHASDFPAEESPSPGLLRQPVDDAMRAVVRPFRERLERAGLRARVRVSFGHAGLAILDAVAEEKADLIAMTTHGRSGISRWVFGSVAEKVLSRCPCPALLLRTSGHADAH